MNSSRKYYQQKEKIFSITSTVCVILMFGTFILSLATKFKISGLFIIFFPIFLIASFIFQFLSLFYYNKAKNWIPERKLPIEIGTIKNLKINSGKNGYYILFDLYDSEKQKIKHINLKTDNLVSMEKIRELTEISFNYINKSEKDIYFPELPSDVTVVVMPYRFRHLEKE